MSKEPMQFDTDAELRAELNVNDKGEVRISKDSVKKTLERRGLNYDEVNDMQVKVNEAIGVIANTAGQFAFDHIHANDEVQQARVSFTVGQTSPTLTVNREKQQWVDPNDHAKGQKTIIGQARLDMKKSMPENFRKDLQRGISTYAETRIGDGLAKNK